MKFPEPYFGIVIQRLISKYGNYQTIGINITNENQAAKITHTAGAYTFEVKAPRILHIEIHYQRPK